MKSQENNLVIQALESFRPIFMEISEKIQKAHRIAQRAARPSLAIDNLDYAINEVIVRMKLLDELVGGGICQHEFARGRAVGSDQDIPEGGLPQSETSSTAPAPEPGRH